MQSRDRQRQEEYQQHLFPDRLFDLLMAHSDFFHDLKAGSVLVAFRNLLVVDNQCRRKETDLAKQHAQKEQRAEHTQQGFFGVPAGVEIVLNDVPFVRHFFQRGTQVCIQ